jgi:trehalose synthase
MLKFKLDIVELEKKKLSDYIDLAPKETAEIRKIATKFKGLKVAHINATPVGGGVAEMLRTIVPLQRDIGLDSNWFTIPPDDRFFEVTKEIHNFMQGKEGDLSDSQKKTYLEYNKDLSLLLSALETDVLLVHDPQPAAALKFSEKRPKLSIWRCHIDTSRPNKKVWDFLKPYLLEYDNFVFTLPEFANNEFPENSLNFITPVIDPLNVKNIAMEKSAAKKYLRKLGIDTKKPLITQVSRFDPWKDPKGVVDSFKLAKNDVKDLQLAMVAQMANDDPEGQVVYEEMKDYVKGFDDVHLFVNLTDNDKAVNAFQVGSDIVLQKSIREGFGLTVTEAMWKGAVVVGGNVGGIRLQIEDGVNGYLVNSSEEAARKIVKVLKDPGKIKEISKNAHESVKNKYLAPHKVLNYLRLFDRHFSKLS